MKKLISIMLFAFLCMKANAQKNDSIYANNYTYQQVADLVKSPQLRYLKIYSYKDSILPDLFSKLKNLEYLEINDAKINSIPLSIGSLSKLKTLIICNGWSKKIQIPSEIGKLTQLKNLQLYNYHFESLPPELGNLVNLEKTMLCGDLTNLPSSLQNLKKLKSLYLAGNQFTQIPSPIFKLIQLESLDMSDNQLSQLNDSIWMLKQLKELSLSSNIELDQLSPRICELQQLKTLYLQDTKISSLPVCLSQNPSLKRIRICNTIIDNPAAVDSVFKDKMDWDPPQNQKVVGYLQFVELTDKECKVYLNLELIEQGEKRKLVNKLLVFK